VVIKIGGVAICRFSLRATVRCAPQGPLLIIAFHPPFVSTEVRLYIVPATPSHWYGQSLPSTAVHGQNRGSFLDSAPILRKFMVHEPVAVQQKVTLRTALFCRALAPKMRDETGDHQPCLWARRLKLFRPPCPAQPCFSPLSAKENKQWSWYPYVPRYFFLCPCHVIPKRTTQFFCKNRT